jgi:ParB family transcriptional regulator, chromosome partitioning protein
MTLKRFLADKNASILARDTDEPTGPRRSNAHTAPGAMLAFNEQMVEAERREAELRKQLQQFDGATPMRSIPTDEIRLSKWANRNEASFKETSFITLKQDIAEAGGNVQPVKVRPIQAEGKVKYELAFGQRRFRACSELGLAVNAVVEDMTDQALFMAMDRENRGREDLSPYELGLHYQRALKTKLWSSQRELAKGLGISQAYVSKVLALADLPKEIIAAFRSPLDIQAAWGAPLLRQLEVAQAQTLEHGKAIKQSGAALTGKQVFDRLLERPASAPTRVEAGGKLLAIYEEKGGRLVVRFEPGTVPETRMNDLGGWIKDMLRVPT